MNSHSSRESGWREGQKIFMVDQCRDRDRLRYGMRPCPCLGWRIKEPFLTEGTPNLKSGQSMGVEQAQEVGDGGRWSSQIG